MASTWYEWYIRKTTLALLDVTYYTNGAVLRQKCESYYNLLTYKFYPFTSHESGESEPSYVTNVM